MKARIALFVCIAALTLGVALESFAQQPGGAPPPPPPFFGGRMAQDLGLSDAQQAQIKSVLDAERATIDPLMKQLGDLHQQMEALTADGSFDEAKVRDLATQQAQVQANLTVEHERIKSKIYNLLTADQRTKLQQFHANHQGHPGHGGRMPPPPPGGNQ